MVLVDREGEILLVNQQAGTLFGYRHEGMVGQKIEILLPDRFRANHPHLRTAFSAHPQKRAMSSRNELYGLRKDGREFPIEASLSPIETEYGLLISSTILDVSARKLAEQTTESGWKDKEGHKNYFLSHVSHELRSPLTAIKQCTTIILNGLAGDLNRSSASSVRSS
jgi:PAS domain S-box-containing protein